MRQMTYLEIPYEAAAARELAKSLGARWNRTYRKWMVPTEHVARVGDAVDAATRPPARPLDLTGRVDVKIPFRATEARDVAKRLGARWHAETKSWAVPKEHVEAVRSAIVAEVCVGEPCDCTGAQIWEGECLATGASMY